MAKYRRIEESLRFCIPLLKNSAVETVEETMSGVYGSGAVFKGPLSEPLNWINAGIFGHELLNYTFVVRRSFGKYNETSGWYDEDSCLYAMQKNETDGAIAYVRMPVVASGLRQIYPVVRDSVTILSKYNITETGKIPDIFDSFRSAFDIYIWVVLVLFTIVFILLVKAFVKMENERVKQRKLRRAARNWKIIRPGNVHNLNRRLSQDPRLQFMAPSLHEAVMVNTTAKRPEDDEKEDRLTYHKDNATYDVLTHLFQVETIDYEAVSMRIALLFLTTLSFYILTYFGNLMSTDMVVDDEPALIRSYKDLLAHPKIQMMFLGFQEDYKEFELAPKGSIKRQLWDKSLQSVNGDRNLMFIQLGSTGGMVTSVLDSVTRNTNVDEKNRIELVAMFSSVLAGTARATNCHLKASFAYKHSKTDESFAKLFKPVQNVYSYLTSDPTEREVLVSPIMRDGFRTPLAKRIEMRLVHLAEVGTLNRVIEKSLVKTALDTHKIETPDEQDVYRACMSDNYKENMKKNEQIAMKPVQFKLLALTCAAILVLALICLFYENWAYY